MSRPFLELTHPETGVTKSVVAWAIELNITERTIFKRRAQGKPWHVRKKQLGDMPLWHPILKVTKTQAEWAKELDLPLNTLRVRVGRYQRGQTLSEWWDMDQVQGRYIRKPKDTPSD